MSCEYTSDLPVVISGPFPLPVTGTFSPSGTQDVNIISSIVLNIAAASLPLPTGAATEATLADIEEDLDQLTFASTRLLVDGSGVTQPISGTITALQGTSPWIVSGTVTATPTGTQDVNIVSTISIPVTGPLTDAQLRATPVPVSGSITTSPNVNIHDGTGVLISSTGSSLNVDVTNTVPVTGTFFQATQPVSGVGNFTVVQPTGTNLHVVVDSAPSTVVTQGTSPWIISGAVTNTPPANQSVNLTQVAGVTLGSPSNYGTSPGAVEVPGVNAFITNTPAVTLTSTTITGTVAVTQSTSPWVVSLASTTLTGTSTVAGNLTNNNAAPIGNNLGVLPALANAANPSWTEGDQVLLSEDLSGNLRVKVNAALPAGSNVIGHIIADSGSTTAVTGNVTVVQATGTNLHAVIDSGSTTTVTGNVTVVQPTGTNLHVVVDSAPSTQVTQGTSPWVSNITQFGSSNVVTGTGTSGAGIPRVTISNDSSLAANQSVNVNQVGGSALTEGQKTMANSVPVVIASDQTTVPVNITQDVTSSTATLTNVAQSSTSVQLLASNTSRKGLFIYNDAGSPIRIKFGTTASATSFTILLNNNTPYEMDGPIYSGRIDGIWQANGNGNARITELT